MIYLLVTEEGIQYPFVKEHLRSAFPNISFPSTISDDLAALHNCFPVNLAEIPDFDPRTERLEEGQPLQGSDGSWEQVLTIRPATEEEIAEYDNANRPEPDWTGFKTFLLTNPGVNQLLTNAIPLAPAAALSLPATLVNLSNGGSFVDFATAWATIRDVTYPSPELVAEIIVAATAANLPAEFLELLSSN